MEEVTTAMTIEATMAATRASERTRTVDGRHHHTNRGLPTTTTEATKEGIPAGERIVTLKKDILHDLRSGQRNPPGVNRLGIRARVWEEPLGEEDAVTQEDMVGEEATEGREVTKVAMAGEEATESKEEAEEVTEVRSAKTAVSTATPNSGLPQHPLSATVPSGGTLAIPATPKPGRPGQKTVKGATGQGSFGKPHHKPRHPPQEGRALEKMPPVLSGYGRRVRTP
eukprot:GHVU01136324.1.p2 GENE.GHVU01136324.1~~GHVU01136324.1.p2  ORF type:complete len:226 (+),score=31.40 GHVU01136324.1:582-1259(+)